MAAKYYSKPKLARVKRRDEWDPYGGFIGDDYPDPNKLRGMDGGSIAGKTNWKHSKLIEVGTPDPIARIEGVRLRAGLFNEDKNQHLKGYYTSPPHSDIGNLPVFTYLPIDWGELSAWAAQKGDLPRPEFVVFGGNYVEVIGEINNDYIIRVMDIDNLDLTSTPDNDPLAWQQMTSVSQDGSHGNAPRGYTFVFPNVGKGDKARIEKEKIEFVDSFTPLWKTTGNGQTNNDSGQEQPMTRAHLVDISYWQSPYFDDGVDEGLPLHGIIQKVAHGLIDYTDPAGWAYQNWWKEQYDSIASFDVLMGYLLFTFNEAPIAQADLAIDIENRNRHQRMVFDYEGAGAYTAEEANDIKRACDHYRVQTGKKAILYLNYSTYQYLLKVLGAAWLSSVVIWLAGGPYYLNVPLTEAQHDGFDPFPSVNWTLLQYSADGNRAADELDFGELEAASIDYDMFKGTVAELRAFVGLDSEPSDCDAAIAVAVQAEQQRIIDFIKGQ